MPTPNLQAPSIFIILLNWNGKKDTLECLSSLAKICYPNAHPVVVDNGSTDDSVAVIRSTFPTVPLIETGENLGFAQGCNAGIAWALEKQADWILLLNNDTVVDADLLNAFMKARARRPEAGIFGGKIYRYDQKNIIDHLGGFWNPAIAEFESPAQHQTDDGLSFQEMQPADTVCGACLLAHRSVFEQIGLLEPRFFLYWEETDFCYRAKRGGFEVWTAPQAKIWHKVSSSFTGGKPHMHYFWWRSRLLWIERNCSPDEKKRIWMKVTLPELSKHFRHFLLKSLQFLLSRNPDAKQKALRNAAGLLGALHYKKGKFGNCPKWIMKKLK